MSLHPKKGMIEYRRITYNFGLSFGDLVQCLCHLTINLLDGCPSLCSQIKAKGTLGLMHGCVLLISTCMGHYVFCWSPQLMAHSCDLM